MSATTTSMIIGFGSALFSVIPVITYYCMTNTVSHTLRMAGKQMGRQAHRYKNYLAIRDRNLPLKGARRPYVVAHRVEHAEEEQRYVITVDVPAHPA